MCELYAPSGVIGKLRDDVAREIGLPAGLSIISGVADGQAAGLEANITEPGRAYLNLGTAVVSGTYSENYSWGNEYRCFRARSFFYSWITPRICLLPNAPPNAASTP